jgi:hypothetical protein
LTSGAVASLRALPREERALVAARIDDLAGQGLPPAFRGGDEGLTAVGLPVGGHVLVCLEEPAERTVYVLALHAKRAPVGDTLRRLAGRTISGWRGTRRGGGEMTIGQDLGFALRSLRRSPGFTFVAVLTLALGIGATAAIFSVANGVLLVPLPYDEPDELVTLWTSWDNFPDKTWVSIPEFQLFHQENRTLEDLALYSTGRTNFTSVDAPEQVGAASLTPNTLDVLGVAPPGAPRADRAVRPVPRASHSGI